MVEHANVVQIKQHQMVADVFLVRYYMQQQRWSNVRSENDQGESKMNGYQQQRGDVEMDPKKKNINIGVVNLKECKYLLPVLLVK